MLFNPTMRTGFMDISSRAMINLSQDMLSNDPYNTYVVNRVSVPMSIPSNRGKGIASRLFTEVCAEADRQGITLMLIISPDGSPGSLTREQLTAWYQRLGFHPDEEHPGWWIRLPRTD